MTSDCAYCAHQLDAQDGESLTECTLSDGKPCLACVRRAKLHIRIEETRKVHDNICTEETRKLLDALTVEEREARRDINRHHDPLHRLPVEISSYIFRFTLPSFRVRKEVPHNLLDSGEEYCNHQGLTLGAVCHGWRKLAWSTPQLWCNVMVTLRYEPTWNRIHVMEDWLERSKPLPLKISLFLIENGGYNAEDYYEICPDDYSLSYPKTRQSEAFKAFINLFNPHSARWETLSIQSPRWLSGRLTGDRDRGAPLLKTLRLMNLEFEGCVFEMEGPKPAPTYLDVAGYRHIDHLAISWSNVTHAKLQCLSLSGNALSNFLHLVPQLVDLNLEHLVWNPSYSRAVAATPPIQLPIQKLFVSAAVPIYGSHSETFYSIVFDSLMLPLLEDLTILNTELPFKSVKRFLERSGPPLKHLTLTIHCESVDQQEAFEFLYALPPSLTKIVLNWMPKTSRLPDLDLHTLFDHLARLPAITDGYPTRLPLLPNLEWFEYYVDRKTSEPSLWIRLPDIMRPLSGNPRPLEFLAFIERSTKSERHPPPFLHKGLHMKESDIRGILGLLEAGVDLHLPRSVSREELLALLED